MDILEQLRGELGEIGTPHFFKPDSKFINWIVDYANDRMILDVGSGDGHIMRALHNAGHVKIVGVDPFVNYMDFMKKAMKECGQSLQVIPSEVDSEIVNKFINGIGEQGKEILVLLCRPCHHPFLTKYTCDLAKLNHVEVLYIGLPENVYGDLDRYGFKYTQIEHEGTSEENEIVLKIK